MRILKILTLCCLEPKGHANKIPTMQFSLEYPEILRQNHMLSLTECVWEFQNNALWDTQLCPVAGNRLIYF